MINEHHEDYSEDQKHIDWKSSVVIEEKDRKFIDKKCIQLGIQHYKSGTFTQAKLQKLSNLAIKALVNQDIWTLDQIEKEEKIVNQIKHQIKYRYDTDSDD